MANEIYPWESPQPFTALGYDGSAFRALRVNDEGTLQVRGEDQLFSFKTLYQDMASLVGAASGDHYVLGDTVPAGEVWCVQSIAALDYDSAVDYISTGVTDGATYWHNARTVTVPANTIVSFNGHAWMKEGDQAYAEFSGVTAGDGLYVWFNGYKMTLET